MPDGGGRRLYELTKEQRPELLRGLLFMTGGGLSASDRSFLEHHRVKLLEKPIALDGLLAAVGGLDEIVSAEKTPADDARLRPGSSSAPVA